LHLEGLSDRNGQFWSDLGMICLVTGGAGYVGSHTVLALLDAGHQVVILDDLSTGFDWSVPATAQLVVGDVGDIGLVRSTLRSHQVDAIFHFAAKTVVPDSFRHPLDYYLTNATKTQTLVAAAVKENVKAFILSSTAAVYDLSNEPVSEQNVIDPQSPYGRSKFMAECIVRDAGTAHGLPHAILRYFNVAGADPAGRSGQSTANATHLIKVAIQTALGRRPAFEVYGSDFPTPDGSGVRDFIHVSDLADAHVLALSRLANTGESLTVNCGYGRGHSVREIVAAVKAVSGKNFEVRTGPRRVGDLASVVANSDRLRSLGWSPRWDRLETIVEHAYRWETRLKEPAAVQTQPPATALKC
jgi:UDP-glucose 4-epimerase